MNKNHPGALHLWIHLWEATDTPERAEKEADRLLPLMPGAGHVVHMPAHIYQRIGRHADVISSNIAAAKADKEYIAQCRAQGLYPLSYYPHNIHFVWMGATAAGHEQLALDSARRVVNSIPQEALGTVPILQGFVVVPYWAMVRFAKWDDILADKGPRHETAFTRGAWRYARALAYTAKAQLAEAEKELAELKTLLKDESLKGQATFSPNTGVSILRIAPEVIAGEIAAKRKDWDAATLHFDRAIRYEDALIYQEPPDWHAPVRQNLGAVLLEAGRPDEAEAVYWEDLKKNPDNVWSLGGLAQALKAQRKASQAARIESRLKKVKAKGEGEPSDHISHVHTLRAALSGERQRHRGPVGRGCGDELVLPVREAGLEMRLERERARAHEPRTVLRLRLQQELHAALVDRIGRRQRPLWPRARAPGRWRRRRSAASAAATSRRRAAAPRSAPSPPSDLGAAGVAPMETEELEREVFGVRASAFAIHAAPRATGR